MKAFVSTLIDTCFVHAFVSDCNFFYSKVFPNVWRNVFPFKSRQLFTQITIYFLFFYLFLYFLILVFLLRNHKVLLCYFLKVDNYFQEKESKPGKWRKLCVFVSCGRWIKLEKKNQNKIFSKINRLFIGCFSKIIKISCLTLSFTLLILFNFAHCYIYIYWNDRMKNCNDL